MMSISETFQESSTGQPVEFSTMELNALVGAPAATSLVSADQSSGESMAAAVNAVNGVNGVNGINGVNGVSVVNGTNGTGNASDEPFDTLDTFLRELQADLAEASQPTSTTSSGSSCRRQRYNIAAANPLLAGTMLTKKDLRIDDGQSYDIIVLNFNDRDCIRDRSIELLLYVELETINETKDVVCNE